MEQKIVLDLHTQYKNMALILLVITKDCSTFKEIDYIDENTIEHLRIELPGLIKYIDLYDNTYINRKQAKQLMLEISQIKTFSLPTNDYLHKIEKAIYFFLLHTEYDFLHLMGG